ncbi:MAG: glycosyltransferase family 2 protein [Proteobacteria bacterium]|nr:glycosyltransferase family 2 protein [Pseudomonadota bacterium]
MNRVEAVEMATSAASPSKTYVVILNWNGWRDTIECLESVFRLQGEPYVAVVCDNASSDGSMEHVERWARGEVAAAQAPFIDAKPTSKPLRYARYTRAEAEAGPADDAPLVLIDTGANLGFAGGCNVGMRYAMTRPDCGHVWLLNSDSVADPQALSALVALCGSRPRVGICGSQVRYYDAPEVVQTFGGVLDQRFCTTHSLHCGSPASNVQAEPDHIDYVPGASMFVTRALLDSIGLMAEDYFLYFEEIDWAERCKSKFDLAVCVTSLVYHRGAASIGSPSERGERGARSEYFLLRGRLLFARKFYPQRLLTVYAGMMASLLNRVRRRQWTRARIALCVLVGRRPAIVGRTGA